MLAIGERFVKLDFLLDVPVKVMGKSTRDAEYNQELYLGPRCYGHFMAGHSILY